MIDEYVRELASRLDAVGVRGSDARRLLTEAESHLNESAAAGGEDEAVRSFGPAGEVAALLAGELATARTRSTAVAAFAVLAVSGVAYAAFFLTFPLAGSPDVFGGSVPGLGVLALLGIVFFPQLAFVSGCLALIRVLRLRGRDALPAAELSVQRWRTGVALAAGMATFVSLSVVALDFRSDLAGPWVGAALVASVVLSVSLIAVAVASIRSARPQAAANGAAENVYDDLFGVLAGVPGLGRARLPTTSRRLVLGVAAVASTAVVLAGIAGSDPLDGLVRGIVEALAVFACYATLARPLGLRR